ncbi:hypothetical protein [Chryseobacterium sp. 22458]|uniref:hypothetical protein n=1 Tax=Chryseobacterium sp. 22458 TaxID=3453921 RepID=UPI003F8272B4
MTHQQILDKLSSKYLVKSIDEDVARLTYYAMCFEKDHNSQFEYIFPKLMLRWNCVLNADKNTVTDHYRLITILALCIHLHKYGFADKDLTAEALKAIDKLNEAVVLSDDFFRKSEEIKKIISSLPVPLKRKPSIPENITFYREKDVVSIQLGNRFYAAYIHRLTGVNESPVIEFYNGVFDKVPTIQELEKLNAKGRVYNDGTERISHFSVSGMKFLPDLANQIKLISACVEQKPPHQHLEKSVGLYIVMDIFKLQDEIKSIFKT